MTKGKDAKTDAPEAAPGGEAPVMPETPATPAPNSTARRSGILGPLLGGALAAAGGFGLAQFDALGLRPDPAPDPSAEIAALKDQLARLSGTPGSITSLGDKLAELDGRLAALESRPAPEAPDLSVLQAIEDRLAAIEAMPEGEAASTAALAARLARLEAALHSLPTTDTTALQAELDATLARLEEAESEADARSTEAEAAAAKASRDVALRALTDAVTAGQPFSDKLAALADPALDAALGPVADTGVPTLAALQEAFPDAARDTLRLAREISPQDGWSDRLVDFLASQTEARSLTPREGNDPDAILSRAEFALNEGRVADALAETATLDPALAPALAAWTADANRHLSAMAALAATGVE
ncbi:MAG TPA: hypothetical protein PKA03_11230 [Tabrizicola sp.]|nr:hypothetical protein [Tabrizicola sp.]